MKELKGEPTQNCATCQYRKRKGSGSYKGVLIRDPDFTGKCCRPDGLCERVRMQEGSNPGCDKCGINDAVIEKDGEHLCKECAGEEDNFIIIDAVFPEKEKKTNGGHDPRQMTLFER